MIESTSRLSRGLAATLSMLVLFVAPASASASTAKEFWLAPPDVSDVNNAPGGEPLYLVIAAGAVASAVTIDQPANGAFTPIVINVPAFGMQRVNLTAFKNQLETRPTNTIANTGLHIVASAAVNAVYEVANSTNAETWTLKGADANGQTFYIPLHKYGPFANETSFAAPHQAFASFEIVGTQPGTLVTIYSPVAVDGHPALQQFSLTLNRGQTYSSGWTGTSWGSPSLHPSGAIVAANKPVAVSIKDDADHNPSGSCYDLLGDQIVPIAALGKEYIAVKGLLNNGGSESVVIIATQNNTRITLDGAATPVVTLFAGEYYRVDMDYLAAGPNNAVDVKASAPIYAMHVSGIGCEMGMALLPSIDRGGSHEVDVVRSESLSFYLMLVAPTDAVGSFAISGGGTATINPAAFIDVPGTGGDWKAARIAYDTTQFPVDVPFHVSNAVGRFHLGVLGGGAASTAHYGYLSEILAPVALTVAVTTSTPSVAEPGGPIAFVARVANNGNYDVQLTSLMDDHLGNLDGQGCALPQTLAAGGFYECAFNDNLIGDAFDILSTQVTAAGVIEDTQAQANGVGTGSITLTDVLPSIAVTTSVSPTLLPPNGGPLTLDVRVDNSSSAEAVVLDTLSDDVYGVVGGQGSCALPQTIAPLAFFECSLNVVANAGTGSAQTDTVTATATDDEANAATAQGSATVAFDTRIFTDGFDP
ncbi:MAG: IgGFc-binding protein [Dokdonella sp.]